MRISLVALGVCFVFCTNAFAQGDFDLPVIETFENKTPWPWAPWIKSNNFSSTQTPHSAHSGKFGLSMSGDVLHRTDTIIGTPGQVMSCWIRFEGPGRMYWGFGASSAHLQNARSALATYYFCVDPGTQALYFSSSPDYTYPLLKKESQTYKMNVWYRVEVVFNTSTNVTGKLYSTNGKTLLHSITIDLPDLKPGGISFSGNSVYVDDMKGGTRMVKATPLTPKIGERMVLQNIQFESGKSTLLPVSYAELDRLVQYLKSNPNTKIEISGYTDNSGNEERNKNLSQERAKAVADYLILKGINKENINAIGYGSSKPIATNDTEEGRQTNRRVEFLITQK